ncbi:hypothetical protein BDP55DRAFT_58702 [Colletotrichum godetiae]|uniref:Uncharacterized protein n=1 Tax=Colletotrichum godetiae TaxID=1209918 RepID=A0AAJ0AU41_9PEZI|nr:uncharacterized protein BDP55DRAFT_58702 [Colletotrichum godetiae]KAK1688174.1 hypothetical protein BDP55DRAFT_58702 [Colletotrichum godetiae]
MNGVPAHTRKGNKATKMAALFITFFLFFLPRRSTTQGRISLYTALVSPRFRTHTRILDSISTEGQTHHCDCLFKMRKKAISGRNGIHIHEVSQIGSLFGRKTGMTITGNEGE